VADEVEAGGSLPDFCPIFEAFASDLKREAERMASLG
jgi:hypothetical protein